MSESVHDGRKFNGNEASAHHNHTFRLFFEVKDFIGGDGMFDARNVRFEGPTTHSDQDIVRR